MTNYVAPDFTSAALVTIDTQQDTLDGQPFEISGTSAVLGTMRTLLDVFRETQRTIVHVVRLYLPDASNADLCRRNTIESGRAGLLANTPGSQLATKLMHTKMMLDSELLLTGGMQSLANNESVIYKPRWGAFFQTQLDDYLRSQNVSTIIFAGCNFPNCPRTSIYQASERDYRIVAIEDAISGFYDRGRRELQNIGVAVMSAADAINELKRTARRPSVSPAMTLSKQVEGHDG